MNVYVFSRTVFSLESTFGMAVSIQSKRWIFTPSHLSEVASLVIVFPQTREAFHGINQDIKEHQRMRTPKRNPATRTLATRPPYTMNLQTRTL